MPRMPSTIPLRDAALMFSLAFAALAPAQPGLLWVRQFGTTGNDEGRALAPDGAGGAYITGWTTGSLGGPALGGLDAFVARFDKAGTRLWIVQFGTDASDSAIAAAPDDVGGAFVAGRTLGDLGNPVGGSDIFLAHVQPTGDFSWIVQFGTTEYEIVQALAPDGAGGVYIAGSTGGSLGGPYAGGYSDAFLARYDRNGQRVWLAQFGTDSEDWATGLSLTSDGVFVAGATIGSLGGPSAGKQDIWLARFDATGAAAWMRQFGTSDDEQPAALADDNEQGVFITGTAGDFTPDGDIFLARFDSDGDQLWFHRFGTDLADFGYALLPDGAGNAFLAGYTWGALGGPNAGNGDAYLALFDPSGNAIWSTQLGSTGSDLARAMAPDAAGGVYIAGPTSGDLGAPNIGKSDVFLARYTHCDPDLNGDSTLDLFDFLSFVNFFNAEDPTADCTADGAFDLFDFLCFVNQFNAGC